MPNPSPTFVAHRPPRSPSPRFSRSVGYGSEFFLETGGGRTTTLPSPSPASVAHRPLRRSPSPRIERSNGHGSESSASSQWTQQHQRRAGCGHRRRTGRASSGTAASTTSTMTEEEESSGSELSAGGRCRGAGWKRRDAMMLTDAFRNPWWNMLSMASPQTCSPWFMGGMRGMASSATPSPLPAPPWWWPPEPERRRCCVSARARGIFLNPVGVFLSECTPICTSFKAASAICGRSSDVPL